MEKQFTLSVIVILITIYNCYAQVPAGYNSVPVFEEHFNGSSGSAPDAVKWSRETGDLSGICNGSGGHRHWRAENASLDGNGHLVIRTHWNPTENHWENGGISSRNKYETTYGYFEARIKLHTKPGHRVSFWLQNSVMWDPECVDQGNDGSEIDIFESPWVGSGIGRIRHAVHWDGYGSCHVEENSDYSNSSLTDGDWHTFGCSWEPEGYTFYFDGVATTGLLTWGGVSDVDEFIRLTTELGWTDCPNTADGTDYAYVDWIKVYKKSTFPDPNKWYYIENRQCPGKRLDSDNCQTIDANNGTADDKKWRFQPVEGEYYYLINKACGDNSRLDSDTCTTVDLNDGGTADDKRWKLESQGDGWYWIMEKACNEHLDIWSTCDKVGTSSLNTGYDKHWKLVEAENYLKSATIATGLPEQKSIEKHVQLYPNPAKNILNIKGLSEYNNSQVSITITDIAGRICGKHLGYQNINIDYLKNGIYIINININEKRITRQLVIDKQ